MKNYKFICRKALLFMMDPLTQNATCASSLLFYLFSNLLVFYIYIQYVTVFA